ncbi:ankyrin repeat and IBR domain-containing protein 1-like isoform X2 [Gigantopelta aegis]|uniref:ankyrin repeat and IBR domain-containing protein 1-like isoform X2 n=1 Tax=Gigantopelta aegis TaxID=1735272 RepID=UPI001B889E6D|nr:ankyrin repeat and IBR domain-containing protein 1-like isoform X2 [Gigantopelta aegis]
MGSASSKFRKHLQNGDEVAALQLYSNNSDLRKGLDPNCSYGDSHQHETPLHFAGRHGMRSLLRIFLYEKGGNPNKTNAKKETCLHCVCMEKNARFYNVRQRRADCLLMVLKWRGATLQEGEIEKINLNCQDEKNNTALHYAASSGLKKCVELLVQYGAPLFMENEDNLTPCDCADKNGNSDIALYLESKMVFSNDGVSEDEDNEPLIAPVEEYCGLRAQDLQEAKDQLLVETADMLSVPLFTAEALLRNHEWSRETLLESWMTNPFACCEKSGVTPPQTLFNERPDVPESFKSPLSSPCRSEPPSPDAECDICASSFLISDEPVQMTCGHDFCRDCWETYLNLKIQEGDAHHITCPAYDCTKLVPVDVIENVVSRDMARRYLQFDIKAFVDSNPDMKWCPYPGCARAVKLPDLDNSASANAGRLRIPSDTSRGVDCGNGHYFCWECYGDSHEPCSCENWVKWTQKIAEIKPEQLNGTDEETETAANCLWLVTNSKACPNCKSPIQKNEGCNHMKCSKCKYDFCWVCLEQWKRHNSSTGGYFKCNRYEAVKKVEDKTAQMVSEAEERNTKMQELNRFVHYYTRFKNHENSYKLEEPLLKTAKDKMMKLAEAVTDAATANAETKFVEDAVHQLLKARRVLRCSYVYAFYLDGPGYKKIVFEFMQTELEECTEILSQMVNRLYLRTPRKKIIDQAHVCKRKRLEFITAISKGLVPPETPPSLRKKRKKKYSMEMEDEDLRKAILASIQDVDPANPWIKDASGRHTNVMAYLDWPADDSDDSDAELSLAHLRIHGKCHRSGCSRPRAPNPRTGEIHNYCSLYCLRCDEEERLEQEQSEEIPEVILDEHMDLLRALEMSRLQYLRDTGLIHVPDRDSDMGIDKTKDKCPVRPRSNSESLPVKPDLTPMEKLDQELQRVLDLSSSISKDSDHKIKLQVDVPQRVDPKCSGQHKRKYSGSRFEETTSTLVPRVPNKSVEDLYCVDTTIHPVACSCDKCIESLGAYAGASAAAQSEKETSTLENNTFGVIKDLSVSNIHAFEDDKTRDFLSKDFASLFQKTQLKLAVGPTTNNRNGGKLFAANTPSEEDNMACVLASPESERSSLSLELWRPCTTDGMVTAQSQPADETDVVVDVETSCGSGCEDEEVENKVDDVPLENEKHAVEEFKVEETPSTKLLSEEGEKSDVADVGDTVAGLQIGQERFFDERSSLLEMAENLVQMTEQLSSQIQAGNFVNFSSEQMYNASEDSITFVQGTQSVLDIAEPSGNHIETQASRLTTASEVKMLDVVSGCSTDHENQLSGVSTDHEKHSSVALTDCENRASVSTDREKQSYVSTDQEKQSSCVSNDHENKASVISTDHEKQASSVSTDREKQASGVSADREMLVSDDASRESKPSDVKQQHKRKLTKTKTDRKKDKEPQSFFV